MIKHRTSLKVYSNLRLNHPSHIFPFDIIRSCYVSYQSVYIVFLFFIALFMLKQQFNQT